MFYSAFHACGSFIDYCIYERCVAISRKVHGYNLTQKEKYLLEQPEPFTEKRKLRPPLITTLIDNQQQRDAQAALVTDEDDIELLFGVDEAEAKLLGNNEQE